MSMFLSIFRILTTSTLDRVLSTVDRHIDAQTDKDRVRASIIQAHYEARSSYMKSGGLILMLLFSLPLAFWYGAVIVYSVFWCAGCAYPQDWTIAALPPPLDEWAGLIIVSIFGVIGVSRFSR